VELRIRVPQVGTTTPAAEFRLHSFVITLTPLHTNEKVSK
jgi:hypothetical protein